MRRPAAAARASFAGLLRPAVLGFVAFLGGCGSVHVSEPLTGRLGGDDVAGRTEFWHQLTGRPVVTHDEAFHALLVFLDGRDPTADYPARVRALRAKGMLQPDFDRAGDEAIDRGTLAVALVKATGIRGGLTMSLTGPTPRYAVRALEHRDLYPLSSPNQTLSGGELVGILSRVEDFRRGARPGAPPLDFAKRTLEARDDGPQVATGPVAAADRPLMLDESGGAGGGARAAPSPPAAPPAAAAAPVAAVVAVVTWVAGTDAQVRRAAGADWEAAKPDVPLQEGGELRTGANSQIAVAVSADETLAVGSGTMAKLMVARQAGANVHVRLQMTGRGGRAATAARSGFLHDTTLVGPTSAVYDKQTVVGLMDELGSVPLALLWAGEAVFENTRGQFVHFGGDDARPVAVRGSQTGAAEEALERSQVPGFAELARDVFDAREVALVLRRGGLVRGDVVAGNLAVSDAQLRRLLPGGLDFVLRWDGGPSRQLSDLNLAVFRDDPNTHTRDFVANPPFVVSLNPGDPANRQVRRESTPMPPAISGDPPPVAFYPRTSQSGGRIGKNSVGPEGLEIASWPANRSAGLYAVVVYNLLDALHPPAATVRPVNYTVDVYLNREPVVKTLSGSVGELQTAPAVIVPVSGSATAAKPVARDGAAAARVPANPLKPATKGKR